MRTKSPRSDDEECMPIEVRLRVHLRTVACAEQKKTIPSWNNDCLQFAVCPDVLRVGGMWIGTEEEEKYCLE